MRIREKTDIWRAMDILSAGVCDTWRNLHRQSPMMKNMKSGDMRIFQSCHQSGIIRIVEETRKQFTILKKLMERENAKSRSSAYGFLQWKTRRFRMAFLISKMERHMMISTGWHSSAGSERTGSWEWMQPGYFQLCMVRH